LEARDVSKTVRGPEGRLDILAGVTLAVHAGESFAIVGASGSGKTTLLGLLAGLDVPSAGSIRLGGQALEAMDEEARADLRRRMVGFVFQSFHLLPALTAEENVMLPLELEGRDDARERARGRCRRWGWTRGGGTTRRSCPAASSSAWRSPAPSCTARACCSPTSPPATSTSAPATTSSTCCSR
jgi:putative ABC transport system ATP-binding protein